MRKTTLTLFLILSSFSLSLFAQQQNEDPDVFEEKPLEGVLRDQSTDHPIPFAKVALYQEEKLIVGQDTDGFGNYSFTKIPLGKYQIKASYYGYEFVDITEVSIEDGLTQIVDLDLEIKNDLYSPSVVLAHKLTYNSNTTTCRSTCTIRWIQEEEISKPISTRSKPNPSERAPQKPVKELSLYPNPSTGIINIEFEFETLQLQLVNPLGQVLGEVNYSELEKDKIRIDLSSFPAGQYFLQLSHEEGTQVEKVIIVGL